jgi:hypothetical protein
MPKKCEEAVFGLFGTVANIVLIRLCPIDHHLTDEQRFSHPTRVKHIDIICCSKYYFDLNFQFQRLSHSVDAQSQECYPVKSILSIEQFAKAATLLMKRKNDLSS